MSAKKYHVSLTEADREELVRWGKSQRHSERERKRARILLLADEGPFNETQEGGAAKDTAIAAAAKDTAIAAQVKVSLPTVNRIRQRFAERGLQPSLRRKVQEKRKERLLDGEGEAHLIALVCSAPPDGHKRWGLHLLKDTLIEQQVVDTISHEAVRQTLKKMHLNPG
jgi:transposase